MCTVVSLTNTTSSYTKLHTALQYYDWTIGHLCDYACLWTDALLTEWLEVEPSALSSFTSPSNKGEEALWVWKKEHETEGKTNSWWINQLIDPK